MNKLKYKLFTAFTLALAFTFSACLTDSDYDNNLIGTKNTQNQNFVEVHLTSDNNTNTVMRSYDAISKDTTISLIPINLTSGPATSDVTITFQVLDTINSKNDPNAAIMKSYVATNGYVIPSSTKYTVLNTGNKVVIPAGSSTGYVKVKFTPLNFLGNTYVFGIKVTGVSDTKYTLSNLTTGFVLFGIKNKYDGNYVLTGSMVDASAAGATFTAAPELNVSLITQDGTSVALFDIDLFNNYFHGFWTGTAYSGYGSFAPVFKFDSNDNVISVVNKYGQPASNGRSAELDPSGINKFDASTKTLKVSYWMNQPSVITPHRTHFVEVYTYVGPR
jgi:hypothetical protein